jgi:hypothetical protein
MPVCAGFLVRWTPATELSLLSALGLEILMGIKDGRTVEPALAVPNMCQRIGVVSMLEFVPQEGMVRRSLVPLLPPELRGVADIVDGVVS